MKFPRPRFAFLFASLVALPLGARADVTLPRVFSDHAVLLKAKDVAIWGKAAPSETVKVTFGTAKAQTAAGADGRWQASLDLSAMDAKPRTLVVEGKNRLEVQDVIVGEVWLASGQSNMEWVVYNTTDAKAVIASSANSALRVFTVKKRASASVLDDCEGEWQIADPKTTGGFTAVGYLFARFTQKALQVPVGLIHASWGGTPIEAWTSTEALLSDADLGKTTKSLHGESDAFPANLAAFQKSFAAWSQENNRTDKRGLDAKAVLASKDGAAWKKVQLPGDFSKIGLPSAGVVWLRRTVDVPAQLNNLSQPLEVGDIAGLYEIYWNGDEVGESNEKTGRRRPSAIYLRSDSIKPGTSTILLRVFNPVGGSALSAPAYAPLRFAGKSLEGEWEALVESDLPELSGTAKSSYPALPTQPLGGSLSPAYLFNGMINPIIPYAIRGAIWYQGESNSGRGYQYRTAFPLMINDWRARWGRGDFDFIWCQLANNSAKNSAADSPTGWADVRESQYFTQRLPRTGQAVLIDQGEELDIHPRNKREVGARLSLIALARTYGKDLAYSGPTLSGASIRGSQIRLEFANTAGGLVAQPLPATYQPRSTSPDIKPLAIYSPGSELQGFIICGKDRKWVWAQAKIEGNAVIVSSPEVPAPVAVRYAWAANPTCNLFNAAGLPAGPFRTDDFLLPTQNSKF